MKAKTLPSAEGKLKRMRGRRWEYILGRYTKLLRVRPISAGAQTHAFTRQALVKVPKAILENLSEVDLAMVVASGPGIVYHHVTHHNVSDVQSSQQVTREEGVTFKVQVILDPDVVLDKNKSSITEA